MPQDGDSYDPPRKPKGLDEYGEDLWTTLVAELIHARIVVRTDEKALQAMCEMWSMYQRALVLAKDDVTDKLVRCAVTQYLASFDKMATKFGANKMLRDRINPKKESKAIGIAPRKRA